MEVYLLLYVDKDAFLTIYNNKLDSTFEQLFHETFHQTYKSFLYQKYIGENKNYREIALEIGLNEQDIKDHIFYYNLNKQDLKVWKEFVLSSMSIFSLKSIISLIGLIPVFYITGYLFMYGFYFGNSDMSLIDVVINVVPFNTTACYLVGLIITGLISYFYALISLKSLGKFFVLFGVIYFIVASSFSLLIIFNTTNAYINANYIIKSLLIWIGPILAALVIFISRFLTEILVKHYVKLILSLVTTGVLFFLLHFIVNPIQINPLLLISALLLIFILITWIFIKVSNSIQTQSKKELLPPKKQEFTFTLFLHYSIFVLSLVIVILIPLLSSILFYTGTYLSDIFQLVNVKQEKIVINGKKYCGQLVGRNDDYFYISNHNKTLIRIGVNEEISIVQMGKQDEHLIKSSCN